MRIAAAAVTPVRQKPGSAQLAGTFTSWLKKFSPGKDLQLDDLFRQVDHRYVIDLSLARRVSTHGVRADGVERLITILGLPNKEEAVRVLGVSNVSLWRWSKEKKFLPEAATEQILRTMDLQMFATEVFGSIEAAQKWLTKLHPLLEGESPLRYASNEFGAQKVRGMLAALRYGGAA